MRRIALNMLDSGQPWIKYTALINPTKEGLVSQDILGVDVGGTLLRAARFDLDLNMLDRAEQATRSELGSEVILERLVGTIRQVLPEAGGSPLGIGLAMPGPLDVREGIVIATPNLPWKNFPIRDLLAGRFGCPVHLGNDADLAGLAEHQLGAGRGARTMVYMTISTGVGGGIIIDGRPFSGRGQGGEVGHMVVDPDGPLCGCGHPGHVESFSSGTGIARIARTRLEAGEESSIRDLVDGDLSKVTSIVVGQAAQAGDPLASEIIRQAGRYLGMGIASLMSALNPEMFVLGGGVTKLGDLLFEPMREAVREYAMHPRFYENTPIVRAELGSDVGLLGAAALVRLMQAG